jgi:alpha-amylase/alpha-mannosidase (GH57 family)
MDRAPGPAGSALALGSSGSGAGLASPQSPPATAQQMADWWAIATGHEAPTGVHVVVHGHFYQPPRENPYLETVVRQPSAAPCHDWNERVHRECYRPNAFARLFNDRGNLVGIVNTFEFMSFNVGPTLMSWLERHDPRTYQRILQADRRSCDRLAGCGNAIAQVYNHIIMPLASDRDKRTQVRWGVADFRARFGRDPQGLWLAEAAVDYATLEVLADEGIEFVILAPSQALRCRPLPTDGAPDPEWLEVGGGQIDPTQPYRCYLPQGETGSDRYVDLFFYDGPISGEIGFGDVLISSETFAARIGQAVRGDRETQVISLATDGETFGHHKKDKEKCLAYALIAEFPKRGWLPSNFAYYLHQNPPTWEVQIKPVTAWSCMHGVDRWKDDCGCGGGGEWHQRWRKPLRETLDWLRDRLATLFETQGRDYFRDPWAARDAYGDVIRDRARTNDFLAAHQGRSLTAKERILALQLLEMQRYALLMFTSCGWFFEELSRPEGTQILRYAGRAMELAAEVTGLSLEKEFIKRLEKAPSNVPEYSDGATIYQKLVVSDRVTLEQVAAAYAIESLLGSNARQQPIYCYQANLQDYRLQRMGDLALAVGHLELTSDITQETSAFTVAVLHLGGWDFHGRIEPFRSRLHYTQTKEKLFAAIAQASTANAVLTLDRELTGPCFGLDDLFCEDRQRITKLLLRDTLAGLDRLYDRVYRNNYGVLLGFNRDELPVPQELQVAADISLGQRAIAAFEALERDLSDPGGSALLLRNGHLAELEAIADEAARLHCTLNLTAARPSAERAIATLVNRLLAASQTAITAIETKQPLPEVPPIHLEELDAVERLVELGDRFGLDLWIEPSQEQWFSYLHGELIPAGLPLLGPRDRRSAALGATVSLLRQTVQRLGASLKVEVAPVLLAL